MRRNGRLRAGYSLVELMIVLVVLGLALAAGVPYLGGYLGSKSLEGSLTSLASRFDLARSRAMAEQNAFQVLLNDPSDGQYRIHDDDNSDGVIDEGEAVLGPYTLPGGVEFASIDLLGDAQLQFGPSGMLRPGQGGTVTLGDCNGREIVLEVYASGLTQVQTRAER